MLKDMKTVGVLLLLSAISAGTAYAVPKWGTAGVKEIQQNGVCNGVVTDTTGETVIGASVVVKGTTNGTITGLDGDFSLSGVTKGSILVVSFVGYQNTEVKWNGQPLTIVLKEDTIVLDDVVVVGYAVAFVGVIEKVYGWDDLHYGESDSVFMHNGDVIYGVKLHLAIGDSEKIKAEMDDHQQSRRAKQPLEKRSAGTMYLRPPGYHVGPMIKACGLIGFAIGDAEVSTKHADFVVNNGNASCEDVLAVLHEVQRRVKEKFGVHIPLDVRMLGEGLEQER